MTLSVLLTTLWEMPSRMVGVMGSEATSTVSVHNRILFEEPPLPRRTGESEWRRLEGDGGEDVEVEGWENMAGKKLKHVLSSVRRRRRGRRDDKSDFDSLLMSEEDGRQRRRWQKRRRRQGMV